MWRSASRLLVLSAISLFLTACETGAGRTLARGYNISPVFLDDTGAEPQPMSWEDDACQTTNGSVNKTLPVDCNYLRRGFLPPVHLQSYKPDPSKAAILVSAETDPASRNRLKNILIRRSDAICSHNKAQIVATKDTASFGLGAAGLVAGGVGGVVSGVAANVMSSVAGLMSGLSAQASKDFYQSALEYAILQQIDTVRASQLTEISNNDAKPIGTYSTDQMLVDVGRYHEDCSFANGLNALMQNAAQNKPTSAEDSSTNSAKATNTANSGSAAHTQKQPGKVSIPSQQ
jgi:hypothetical protein